MASFISLVAGSKLLTWIFMIVVSVMVMILSSIVISWVDNGYVEEAAESTRSTAKGLSVFALIPAILALIVVAFKMICAYSPLKFHPLCNMGSIRNLGETLLKQ